MKTTWGADSQMTPVAIHIDMGRDSFAVVAVTPGSARSAGTHQTRRPERERPPQSEGLVRAWGQVCFHTLAPALQGVAPVPMIPGGKATGQAR